MYGSNHPTRSSQDDTTFGSDTSPYQLLPVGGTLHAVPSGVGAVAGQMPVMPHLHPFAPRGLPVQQGQHVLGNDAAGTTPLDQGLLSPPSVHCTPPCPVMAKPPQPHSHLVVPPVHHTALPRARQLFGRPTHLPVVQVGQPIQQQQVALPIVPQQALAWARSEVLQLQQSTAQHVSPVQQRPIWRPPVAAAESSLTALPPHIYLQRELELQSQSLQLQLLHVQLQQQQLRQLQGLDVPATGQYIAGMVASAAAPRTNTSLASSSGGTGAGSAADVSAPVRRKTRRGPNRGRSKSKKGVAVSSAGDQSGAQTSSTGGTASTASDAEELQQQASPTVSISEQGHSVTEPASQQTLAVQSRTAGKGLARGKGGAGDRQPQQSKEQSRPQGSKQLQDGHGSAPAAVSPPAASQSASVSSQGGEPKQPGQRTTGLSHRQRYRRKQWELHRAMEQQRLQQQQQLQMDTACQGVQQQVNMLSEQVEGVSLSTTSVETHVDRVLQQSSASTAGLTAAQLAPPSQSTSQHGATDINSTGGGSSSAALQQTLQKQDNTAAPAAVATGSLDQHIDDWLSKFLEL